MSRRLTEAEKAERAQAREAARVAALDERVAEVVASWPPISDERLRRVAAVLDPPPLSDTA